MHNTLNQPLEAFGKLQERYQSLPLKIRAQTVLKDAGQALEASMDILKTLSASRDTKQLFAKIRKNSLLAGKMRPSEAKNLLQDASLDFIEGTLHKLAAWKKTMERLAEGEDVEKEGDKEFIPASSPLALSLIGTSGLSSFLSIIQLALMDLKKTDSKNADRYQAAIAEVRRCAMVLSDCEDASGISGFIR